MVQKRGKNTAKYHPYIFRGIDHVPHALLRRKNHACSFTSRSLPWRTQYFKDRISRRCRGTIHCLGKKPTPPSITPTVYHIYLVIYSPPPKNKQKFCLIRTPSSSCPLSQPQRSASSHRRVPPHCQRNNLTVKPAFSCKSPPLESARCPLPQAVACHA